ncbi:MAG: hypothetical protein L0177_16815, partial [Chloroflexi bacterium]|nr:hypothetical protein [Chloroflexota bacterium]
GHAQAAPITPDQSRLAEMFLTKIMGGGQPSGGAIDTQLSLITNIMRAFGETMKAAIGPALEMRNAGYEDAMKTITTMSRVGIPLPWTREEGAALPGQASLSQERPEDAPGMNAYVSSLADRIRLDA